MQEITVIIPWYRYSEIIRCLNSLSRSIIPKYHKVLLIDDNTDISDLTNKVKEFCKTHSFVYYRNRKNIGYTSSAKKGMELTKTDVVLLNSDTIVTRNFLNKLSKHAYMDSRVATVTPMSNQANMFSLSCQNLLKLTHGVAIINKILEITYLNKNVSVFSGHGFCLYIKRSVINQIGVLDDFTFPGTYCEENDYCLRCSRKGYKHIVALDTFVYHQGRGTHGDFERTNLLSINYPRLLKKYPEIPQMIERYYSEKPLRKPHQLISLIDKIVAKVV